MLESFAVVLYFGIYTDRMEQMWIQHPGFMYILMLNYFDNVFG